MACRGSLASSARSLLWSNLSPIFTVRNASATELRRQCRASRSARRGCALRRSAAAARGDLRPDADRPRVTGVGDKAALRGVWTRRAQPPLGMVLRSGERREDSHPYESRSVAACRFVSAATVALLQPRPPIISIVCRRSCCFFGLREQPDDKSPVRGARGDRVPTPRLKTRWFQARAHQSSPHEQSSSLARIPTDSRRRRGRAALRASFSCSVASHRPRRPAVHRAARPPSVRTATSARSSGRAVDRTRHPRRQPSPDAARRPAQSRTSPASRPTRRSS